MKIRVLLILLGLFGYFPFAHATGEPGTYFNIFVPPSNEIQSKDVALIVTAVADSTSFNIQDTGEDGDTDDSKQGILRVGQSYILYLRNNGVNDDAPHAGEGPSKQDGDHFIITSNKSVLVNEANLSGYQHTWAPCIDRNSIGSKFYIYSQKGNGSINDLNVMAYQDSTIVTVYRISENPTIAEGYTDAGTSEQIVLRKVIAPGKDLIYFYQNGIDLLEEGHTYLVLANKRVTVTYGALVGQEHDGGGYVPSMNGSSAGSLFYFPIPHQDDHQQEIRIVSWTDGTDIYVERFENGFWAPINTFSGVDRLQAVEWTGKQDLETYSTIFRVRCEANKKISVFESNWVETGSPSTSDIGAMVSSGNTTCSGREFLVYMAPPCMQDSVTNPFTGTKMPSVATHAFIFGNRYNSSQVTVKDAYTNGAILNRSYTIPAGKYADCLLDSIAWNSIYNGTGTSQAGLARPYLLIQSNQDVSVMTSNFNDNWMMYYGSSMPQNLAPVAYREDDRCSEQDTTHYQVDFQNNDHDVDDVEIWQCYDEGMNVCSAVLVDSTSMQSTVGVIEKDRQTGRSRVRFPRGFRMLRGHKYTLHAAFTAQRNGSGKSSNDELLLSVETAWKGLIDSSLEMANVTDVFVNQLADTIGLMDGFDRQWTSIAENNQLEVLVYPNPTTGNVFIQFQEVQESTQVEVLDMAGRLMLKQSMEAGEQFANVSLQGLHAGMYLLYIKQGDLVAVRKVQLL
ncbi:MAG: T9SS type A sorting domain-containing protein [Chitinophagales bacterium]|nr:T9SS type A sorting domain-containing protein [Chitinophagales bacterium]